MFQDKIIPARDIEIKFFRRSFHIKIPQRRRLTKWGLCIIVVITLLVSYQIALYRVRTTVRSVYKAGEFLEQGRYEESLEQFEKVVARKPRWTIAWNGKGICLMYLGRYEEAIASYEQALKIDPTYLRAWAGKAVGLEKLGRYNEAVTCFKEILAINPDDSIARRRIESLRKIRNVHTGPAL